MRVSFTCEKCGAELLHPVVNPPKNKYGFMAWTSPIDGDIPCPKCAPLTYGPITEEMMVRALYVSGCGGHGYGSVSFSAQARFVLRLLNEMDGAERLGFPFVSGDERNWLLNLAKGGGE